MDEIPALSRTVQLRILSCHDAQDVKEATQVEGVESTFLMSMQGALLTAMEKRADHTRLVDLVFALSAYHWSTLSLSVWTCMW